MTASLPCSIEDRLRLLDNRWDRYLAAGRFEQFVEFALAVDSLAESFSRLRLPGLARLCEGLENATLAKLGEPDTHPIAQQDARALRRQIDALRGAAVSLLRPRPQPDRRADQRVDGRLSTSPELEWIKPRALWMVTADMATPGDEQRILRGRLEFFGFRVFEIGWFSLPLPAEMPLAVLFLSSGEAAGAKELEGISTIRVACPASQLFYLGVRPAMEPIVALMRAGIDVAVPAGEQPATVVKSVLDLVQTSTQEQYRVLVVEDSSVAVALIRHTLAQHAIDAHAISDPAHLLDALDRYRPDLVLMDMYMPRFNGVEATRVLRQMASYSDLPIIYLSAESKVGLQVEALRLGGDQFLMKPFNPVLLAAAVKTRIDRYRESQRCAQLDGLTGLLTHSAAKSRLAAMVSQRTGHGALAVAMIDIDHFKAVNDTYGHPVGDQVIRDLAWLLKGRLRSIDLLGRYGGEEFMVALPDVSLKQAGMVIDRIRADFAALPHPHSAGVLYATFSAGLAAYPRVASAAALTEAADQALMQAKRLGRNRVETREQDPSPAEGAA